MDLPAPREHFRGADDFLHWPVTALDQDVRAREQYQFQRRVIVEPSYQVNRLERSNDRQAVLKGVDGSVPGLTQASHRGIGVERNEKARAPCASLREVGYMAAMEDVEAPVGEDQGPRQRW